MENNLESPAVETAPQVTVLILNYNGGKYLPQCLFALERQTFTDFEILVVDNGSSDGSVDDLESEWPQVRVIRTGKNLGFAAGNNVGAKAARGQWLALLNSDAFAEPEWLETLMYAAEAFPEKTFFASMQLQARDPRFLDGTGDGYHISGVAWRINERRETKMLVKKVEEVFSACGAAAFYPRAAFLEIGGFDEDYFCNFEDVDLGFRLRLIGYTCLLIPKAVVHHVGSGVQGRESTFAVYHYHRNMVWTYIKDMPSALLWRSFLWHLLANTWFLLYYSFCFCARAVWSAKWDALKELERVLEKRKQVQATMTVSPEVIRKSFREVGSLWRASSIAFLPLAPFRLMVAVAQCRKVARDASGAVIEPALAVAGEADAEQVEGEPVEAAENVSGVEDQPAASEDVSVEG